ncbi:MAG: hypothetical protein ABUS79_10380, partial [Pseudomonadota bacterium]
PYATIARRLRTPAASRSPQNSVALARAAAARHRRWRGTRIAARMRMRSVPVLAFVVVASMVLGGCGSSPGPAGGTGGTGGTTTGGTGGSATGGAGGVGGSAGGHTGGASGNGGQAGAAAGGHGGQAGAGGTGGGGGSAAGGQAGGAAAGHGGGGHGGANATDCTPACATGSICVGTGTQGGAVFLADAGVCPAGRHAENNICVQDLFYQCMPIPAACNGTVSCSCAAPTLCGGRTCLSATAIEIRCVLEVP